MSKIIFVSDIHLNLRKDSSFESNRFIELMSFISEQDCDYVFLGGDIFNFAKPTFDELSLFYRGIDILKGKEVFVISGNHEDISKTECVFDKIPQVGYKYFSITEEPIILDNVAFYFVSHHLLKYIKELKLLDGKKNVLISHIRCSIGFVKEEYNIKYISRKFNEVFLGDIHVTFDPYHNVHYCGSPYNINYDLARETGVFLINTYKGNIDYKIVPTTFLPQRIKYNLDIAEYKKMVCNLDDNNLYRMFLSGDKEEFVDLKDKHNIKLIFNGSSSNTEDEEDIISNIKTYSDPYDTLYTIIRNRGEISDKVLAIGNNVLKDIRRKCDSI